MKYLLAFCFLTAVLPVKAQQVDLIAQKNYPVRNKMQRAFYFLEQGADTGRMNYIATIRATIGDRNNSIVNSFAAIKKMGNELGGNCFRLQSVEKDSSLQSFTVDVFLAGDSVIENNTALHPQNMVYVFCNERRNKETHNLKVNGTKTEFQSGTYLSYQLTDGDELKLSKGGLTGSSVILRYRARKAADFFSITGFGVGVGPAPQQITGLSFNTGRINTVDKDLGFLLIHLLAPAN